MFCFAMPMKLSLLWFMSKKIFDFNSQEPNQIFIDTCYAFFPSDPTQHFEYYLKTVEIPRACYFDSIVSKSPLYGLDLILIMVVK